MLTLGGINGPVQAPEMILDFSLAASYAQTAKLAIKFPPGLSGHSFRFSCF